MENVKYHPSCCFRCFFIMFKTSFLTGYSTLPNLWKKTLNFPLNSGLQSAVQQRRRRKCLHEAGKVGKLEETPLGGTGKEGYFTQIGIKLTFSCLNSDPSLRRVGEEGPRGHGPKIHIRLKKMQCDLNATTRTVDQKFNSSQT